MCKAVSKILLFFLLISFFIGTASPVLAKDYIVKGYIFIPADYRDKPNEADAASLEKYKKGIISYLEKVQSYYAAKVNGKKFNFDPNVGVVYSDRDLQKSYYLEVEFKGSLFGNDPEKGLGGIEKFPEEDGVIKVVWVVGAQHSTGVVGFELDNARDPTPPEKATVVIRYDDLIAIDEASDSYPQKQALFTLAHELGHAFGLTRAGWALSHPCTVKSGTKADNSTYTYPVECKENAPKPYAPAIEYQTLMGYEAPVENWPNVSINNTDYNPELEKLYMSLFINPQGDPGPKPKPSYDNDKKPVITGLSPSSTVNVGQEFTIQGANLSAFKTAEIWRQGEENTRYKLDVISNDGSSIVARANTNDVIAANSTSEWIIKLFNEKGEILAADQHLIIRSTTKSIVLTIHADTKCGPDKGKFIPVSVILQDINGQKASANSDPSMPMSFTIDSPEPGQQFTLTAEAVNDTKPSPEKYVITIPSPPADIEKTVEFSYPKCPDSTPTETVTPTSNLIPTKAVAVVHGWTDGNFDLPKTWKKLSVGGRVYVNNDQAACIMTDVKLLFQKVKDASGANITPIDLNPTFMTVKEGNEDGMTTKGVYLNCQSYWVNLDSAGNSNPGTYRLTLKYAGDDTYQPVENSFSFKIDTDNKVILTEEGPHRELVLPASNSKTATHVYIYGKEVDLNDPYIPLEYDLPVTEGVAADVELPGLVQYSDGSSKSFTLYFKYRPVAPAETTSPSGNCSNPAGGDGQWRYECTFSVCPTDSSQGVGVPFRCESGQWVNKNPSGECTGQCKASGTATPTPTPATEKTINGFYCSGNKMMKRHTDNTADYNCTCGDTNEKSQDCGTDQGDYGKTICQDKSQAEANAVGLASDAECVKPTPTPTPSPSCSTSSSSYCIACQRAVVVSTKLCTGLATIRETQDKSCNDLSLCNNPSSCQVPYTQCGDTAGLEDEPANHVFYITPICDNSGEVTEYRKVDLGRLTNQCGN